MSFVPITLYDFDFEIGHVNVPTFYPNIWINVNSDYETLDGKAFYDDGAHTTYRIAAVNGSSALDIGTEAVAGEDGITRIFYETTIETPEFNPLSSGEFDNSGILVFQDGSQTVAAGAQRGLWFVINRSDSDAYTWSIFAVDTANVSYNWTSGSLPSLANMERVTLRIEMDIKPNSAPAFRAYIDGAIVLNYLGVSLSQIGYSTPAAVAAAPKYFAAVSRQPYGSNENGVAHDQAWKHDSISCGHLAAFNPIEDPQFPEPELAAASTLTPISLSNESNNTGAYSFPMDPSWSVQLTPQMKVNEFRTDYEDYNVVHPGQSAPRRRWSLQFGPMGETERDTFRTFITNVAGTHQSFTWTDATTAEVIEVRAIADPSISEIGPDVFVVRFDVEELLAVT